VCGVVWCVVWTRGPPEREAQRSTIIDSRIKSNIPE
jgi:hypothetical protein